MTRMSGPLNLVSAARRAGVGPATIRYWIITGLLTAKKRGGVWEIDPIELDRANTAALAKSTRGLGRGPRGILTKTDAGPDSDESGGRLEQSINVP